jgi:3-dehydroquinate dehydratase type I
MYDPYEANCGWSIVISHVRRFSNRYCFGTSLFLFGEAAKHLAAGRQLRGDLECLRVSNLGHADCSTPMSVHNSNTVDIAKALRSMARDHTPSELNNVQPVTSAPSSRQQSPPEKHRPRTHQPSVVCTARRYGAATSIALVGIRGSGLSTLAVLAASALGFRLLDADQQFYQTTGLSRAQYKTVHGMSNYRRTEVDLLRSMLLDHPTRAVIVCGPGAVETTGQSLLAKYASTHPVVYVTRDAQDIQTYLRVHDVRDISALNDLSAPRLRAVSNFEFYNISYRDGSVLDEDRGLGSRLPKPLALKQVERDFLRLVHSMKRTYSEHRNDQGRLSSLPIESRPYTYALVLQSPVPDAFWASAHQIGTLADAVELKIPCSDLRTISSTFNTSIATYITRQFYIIRRRVQVPLMLHIELDGVDITETEASIEFYFAVLHHGLRLAPDFLCVDLTCDSNMVRGLVAAKGSTKIIAQFHDTQSESGWYTHQRKEKVSLSRQLGADLVRLTQKATTLADNFAVRGFIDQITASTDYEIPIIAYNTGKLGRMSRYLNGVLSPVTDPSLPARPLSDPYADLLTTRQAQSALFSSSILDPMYFGIYGSNVAQSLSPAMHNAAFHAHGLRHEYTVFQHTEIQELKRLLSDPNLGGISVTAPFKSDVIPFINHMSMEAQIIGAVNTLIPLRTHDLSSFLDRNRAGPVLSVYGDNTDWVGIRECIHKNLSPINTIRPQTTALVIGAGGMARAATYALVRLGVRDIIFHNRTKKRAEALIDHFRRDWPKNDAGERIATSNTDSSYEKYVTVLPTMRLLEKAMAWPAGINHPTIVVSCVATNSIDGTCSFDNSLPIEWLASPTGGVMVEVTSKRNLISCIF